MLIDFAIEGEFEAVLPVADDHPQPLLAVYHRERALAALEAARVENNLRVNLAIAPLVRRNVLPGEWHSADPAGDSFRTCNTPGALAALEEYASGKR
jgi:molybdopterin-guanine dinucleotide biosynthesis protein A